MAHYRTEEHQEKVATVGLDHESGPSILHSIEGELSSDIRCVVKVSLLSSFSSSLS